MSFVMMQLGRFQFSVETAAYQELSRSTQWRWPELETYGSLPTSQYTGPGKDTLSIKGVIFPEFRGGFDQVDQLRSLGDEGGPQILVSGEGAIMGRWCIEQLDEGQTILDTAGRPRRQELSMQLKRFN